MSSVIRHASVGRPTLVMLSLLAASLLVWICARRANAQEGTPQIRVDREVGAGKSLALEVGQNRLLVLSEQIVRVSVADPKVADLKVITPTQLLLTAKGVGSTDLTVWNKQDQPLVMGLRVSRNLDAIRRQLKELFPQENLEVAAAGELVVLTGEVSDVRLPERVAELAQLHAEKVVNLVRVRGNQQVQLEVKFAEVSRRGLREMSFNLFHQNNDGKYIGGITSPTSSPPGTFIGVPGTGTTNIPPLFAPNSQNSLSVFFSGLPRFPFSAMVSLLESTGLAKVLAEPTLVAMSGQEAKFLAGGEFPVPYSTTFGQVTIDWKKFGIILNFTPTVIDGDMIHLRLRAEVSDVDPSRSVVIGGFAIPGLISRQSETTVRLGDGQSFAVAGLLSNRIRSQIDRVPLLGDLPVLGMLFRSVNYRRDESELLVVITARLAKPMAPHEVPPLPTEAEMNDPNDLALFLLGSDGSYQRGEAAQAAAPPPAAGGGGEPLKVQRGPSGQIGFVR